MFPISFARQPPRKPRRQSQLLAGSACLPPSRPCFRMLLPYGSASRPGVLLSLFTFRPSAGYPFLLCPLLTSGGPSHHLSMTVALGRLPDLPGYCAHTFALMSAGSTSARSVQVSGFDDNGRLAPRRRLISVSCSSNQRFAHGFLRIPSRQGHPCRSANTSPCRACRGLAPPSICALPGAP